MENSGRSQAVNLLKAKVKNGIMSLEKEIATDIYSTNADADLGINGLRQMVKASGQVGHINSSDFAGWVSDIDASSATLTLALMEQSWLDASDAGEEPDIAITTKFVYKKYFDLLQANQRFGPAAVGDAGFGGGLLFNQVPIVWDKFCPGTSATGDNHLFFLNSNWLYFYVHKDMNMIQEKVAPPATQVSNITRVLLGANLATDNRRMHSAFTVLNH
jgi:hypothetical protein